MDRNGHIVIAILFGGILSFVLMKLNLWDFIYYAIPMYITSILPDILEPATDYRHRGFFHSKTTLKFLCKYALGTSLIISLFFHSFFYIFFGIIGYILHLLADWTTPMGLPE